MILISQDIREDHNLVTLFDQTHGHSRHGIGQRHAGVHECQGGTADGGHGARPIGFQYLRHDPDGVREFTVPGQHRLD